MTSLASSHRAVLGCLAVALAALFLASFAQAGERGSSKGCPYSTESTSADGGTHGVHVPQGATGVQICRYYRRGKKVVNAPGRFLEDGGQIRSLTRQLNRLRPAQTTSERCAAPAHGWIDIYFGYPDNLVKVTTLLGGCRLALGPGHAESLASPQLIERLVGLTSR